jgi:hypothetical protein
MKILIVSGRVKELKKLITQAWLKNCTPVPPLESIDFGVN